MNGKLHINIRSQTMNKLVALAEIWQNTTKFMFNCEQYFPDAIRHRAVFVFHWSYSYCRTHQS